MGAGVARIIQGSVTSFLDYPLGWIRKLLHLLHRHHHERVWEESGRRGPNDDSLLCRSGSKATGMGTFINDVSIKRDQIKITINKRLNGGSPLV